MEIAAIKTRLSIHQVLSYYNLTLNKNKQLICPFHKEKNTSLQVYPKTDTYHCFGCGKTGDVIQFIEDFEKISKHEAILKAKELTGQAAETPPQEKNLPTMQVTFSKLQQSIQRSQKAQDYLKSRNIELAKHELGYNTGTTYNKMKYCVIFPLKDKQNNIASFYGRSVIDNTNSKHYYLTNRKGLYPNYPKPGTTKLILTEAIIDTATLLQINEITAEYELLSLYGTNGLTEAHKQAIKELNQLQEIILFFDGDEPGREAIKKHSETLQQLKPGIKISYVQTPDGEDINSLSVKYDNDCLLQLLNERTFLLNENNSIKKKRTTGLNITHANKINYTTQTAIYHIKGGLRKELDSLRVSLVIENPTTTIKSRSKLDLYEDKQVEKLSREASEKLGLRSDLLEMDLSAMTDLLEEYREQAITAESNNEKPEYKLDPTTINQCTNFLKQADLINRINGLIGKSGVIGEEHNRLFLFVIASSYKMPDTLHALIQGSSGSGKTHLLSKIGGLIPPEDSIFLTRVTESSFYNYDEKYFKHKLLCMEDLDGLKEEAYLAFRELQSKGMLTSSTSIKNENGSIQGMVKTVKGPIASISATTKGAIYEDNMSRIFLIAVNESNEQTHKIIKYQTKRQPD
jgi:DNA primase